MKLEDIQDKEDPIERLLDISRMSVGMHQNGEKRDDGSRLAESIAKIEEYKEQINEIEKVLNHENSNEAELLKSIQEISQEIAVLRKSIAKRSNSSGLYQRFLVAILALLFVGFVDLVVRGVVTGQQIRFSLNQAIPNLQNGFASAHEIYLSILSYFVNLNHFIPS